MTNLNRININVIKYQIQVVKYNKLKLNERKKMIYLFKKCEKDLMTAVPDFFSQKIFLGQKDPCKNATIFLLHRIINNNKKILIGFLAFDNLINDKKVTQKMLIKFINPKEKGGYLWWICGNPRYQGVSKPLFQEFNKYIQKNKYKYVLLVTEKIKKKLIKLYQMQEFKSIGYTTIGEKNNMVVMKKLFL